jgi:hypothetical protein
MFGLLLIVVMLAAPGGIVGTVLKLFKSGKPRPVSAAPTQFKGGKA